MLINTTLKCQFALLCILNHSLSHNLTQAFFQRYEQYSFRYPSIPLSPHTVQATSVYKASLRICSDFLKSRVEKKLMVVSQIFPEFLSTTSVFIVFSVILVSLLSLSHSVLSVSSISLIYHNKVRLTQSFNDIMKGLDSHVWY